ncbi:hypothetical protein [Sulfobacillus thermosulfidooxidans]|uniref:hypothetical protein n=1 Tax=Sulfobacillus thermosulfidooxidans TaxID=28034 RepID=UPI0012FD8F7B|nr:hypothetical protein [Sulfobacillus thermosulfidooxidans]
MMQRCLIDGGPEWFDRDKATRLAISPELSLGVRHVLYRTATGQYVIERDTRWENPCLTNKPHPFALTLKSGNPSNPTAYPSSYSPIAGPPRTGYPSPYQSISQGVGQRATMFQAKDGGFLGRDAGIRIGLGEGRITIRGNSHDDE